MIELTMPDGSIREAEAGISALDLVKSISNSLAKKTLAVKINDETKDLTTVLTESCKIQFLTFEDADG
ncbi:MAG: TGS domain-containing protein, partial [Selenomonadaceae bacterium]|nr:TGS domain-containing protein [Selenomonadaceae bacterium]